jgi:hypothetical protein
MDEKHKKLLRNAWERTNRWPPAMRFAKMLYNDGVRCVDFARAYAGLDGIPEPFRLDVFNYLRDIENGTLCCGRTPEQVPDDFDDLTIAALCGKIPSTKGRLKSHTTGQAPSLDELST